MRAFILALALGGAAPAAAEGLSTADRAFELHLQQELFMQQQMLRQREVALSNELMALDARVRTEQAVRDLEARRVQPMAPPLDFKEPPPAFEAGGLASIPDDRLAASNARVREAARNRR